MKDYEQRLELLIAAMDGFIEYQEEQLNDIKYDLTQKKGTYANITPERQAQVREKLKIYKATLTKMRQYYSKMLDMVSKKDGQYEIARTIGYIDDMLRRQLHADIPLSSTMQKELLSDKRRDVVFAEVKEFLKQTEPNKLLPNKEVFYTRHIPAVKDHRFTLEEIVEQLEYLSTIVPFENDLEEKKQIEDALRTSIYDDMLSLIEEYEKNPSIPRVKPKGIKQRLIGINSGKEALSSMAEIDKRINALKMASEVLSENQFFPETRSLIKAEIERQKELLKEVKKDFDKSDYKQVEGVVSKYDEQKDKVKNDNDIMQTLINYQESLMTLDKNSPEYKNVEMEYQEFYHKHKEQLTDAMIREAQNIAQDRIKDKNQMKHEDELQKEFELKERDREHKEELYPEMARKDELEETPIQRSADPYYQHALDEYRKIIEEKAMYDKLDGVERPWEYEFLLATMDMKPRDRALAHLERDYGEEWVKKKSPAMLEEAINRRLNRLNELGINEALYRLKSARQRIEAQEYEQRKQKEDLSNESVTNVFVEVPLKEDVKEQIEVREFVEKPKGQEIDFADWSLEDIERYKQTGELPTPKPHIVENEHSNSL